MEYLNCLRSDDNENIVFNDDINNENFKEYLKHIENKGKESKYYLDYNYHLNVLPQPYFGDICNANVLFLALNPSYDCGEKYPSNDEKDKVDFNDSKKTLKDYICNLIKVNFFSGPPQDNQFFVNGAWYWYRDKVIGENVGLQQGKKAAFLNLCPYHSKRYNDIKMNSYSGKKKIWDLFECIKCNSALELIVVIWGKKIWDNFIKEYSYQNSNDLEKYFDSKVIYLNKTSKGKYGYHINKISDILKNGHHNDYDKIKEYFKEE